MGAYEKLKFRRQFFIAACETDSFPGWKYHKICSKFHVYWHPDLAGCRAESEFIEILCLGFFIDYNSPTSTNVSTLERIVSTSRDIEQVVSKTNSLAGRWLFIVKTEFGQYIFNDPIASRQLYFHYSDGGFWGASQPHTIAAHLGVEQTENTDVLNFIENDLFSTGEAFWINYGSSYDNINHLPPNHYIEVNRKRITRFWPKKKIGQKTLKEIRKRSKYILQNIYHGLTSQYELIQPITAGWDSRVLLAASRPFKKKIQYYIQIYSKSGEENNDVQVGSMLASYLKLPFDVITCNESGSKQFAENLKKNVSIKHDERMDVLYYNFFENFQEKINISGYAGEIARLRYGTDNICNAEKLAAKVGLPKTPFIISELQKWIDENRVTCKKYNLLLTDLFYWEVKMGNWGSQFASELDIAIEEFYPFNCRDLITVLLSSEEKLRSTYSPITYIHLIKSMWKKALNFPINGVDPKLTLRRTNKFAFYLILKKLHIYEPLRKIFNVMSQR